MNENSILYEHIETPEELLWPPRIDAVGIVLIALSSVIVGGFISLGILVSSFFAIGKFTIESGVSPMILAMSTFFSLLLGGSIYLKLAKIIFPSLYIRTAELYKHMMLFMVILYIFLMPVYLLTSSILNANAILVPYLIHIILGIFGIEIILGIIAQYRYVLLAFYANVIAMIFAGGIVFLIFAKTQESSAALFVLMGLSILTFFLSTLFIYIIKFLYYKFYTLTGNDPLGSFFVSIENEERQKVENAKNTLLKS